MTECRTYRDEFPAGTRVVVRAPAGEGTDHEFNGRAGTVVDFGHFIAVELDRLPRGAGWKNPVLLCPHNLRRADGEQGDKI